MSKFTQIMPVRWEYKANGDYVVVAGEKEHTLAFVCLWEGQWLGFVGEDTVYGKYICKKSSLEEAQQAIELELGIRSGPIGTSV